MNFIKCMFILGNICALVRSDHPAGIRPVHRGVIAVIFQGRRLNMIVICPNFQ